MRLSLLVLSLSSLFVIGTVACGAAKTCTAQSCPTGCCSANGECFVGIENSACGTAGAACVDCTQGAQVCTEHACVASATGGGGGTDAGTGGGGGSTDGGTFTCTRTNVECSDQTISELGLYSTVATGALSNGQDGMDFTATIDARAGGSNPTESYVYVRFTDFGLEKLQLSDMTALDSMDWDLAFRRYVIRINSGDSGPSCVAAELQPLGYDLISSVPANYLPEVDDFLERAPACTFIPDGSGLGTSPRTYLSTFYQYVQSASGGCVKMTGKAYVIRTHTGRHVKFTVKTYYATEAAQQLCDTTSSSGGAAGGTVRVRWRYLD